MGNDQSLSGGSSSFSSSVGSSSLSFLTRNRTSTHKSPVVVVGSRGGIGNPEEDENLKKLREILRFKPLLQSVLPGGRDAPSVFSKINPVYISRFVHRIQEHFTICHQLISDEQNSILARISEVDHKTSTIFRRLSLTSKKYDGLTTDLKKVHNLSTQIESIQFNMDGIIKDLEMLNDLLPEDQRLPGLPKLPATSGIQAEVAIDAMADGSLNK